MLLSMISPPKYLAYTRLNGRPNPNPASGSVDPKSAITVIYKYIYECLQSTTKSKSTRSHFHPRDQPRKSLYTGRVTTHNMDERKKSTCTYVQWQDTTYLFDTILAQRQRILSSFFSLLSSLVKRLHVRGEEIN